jgi:hypothetical protein
MKLETIITIVLITIIAIGFQLVAQSVGVDLVSAAAAVIK